MSTSEPATDANHNTGGRAVRKLVIAIGVGVLVATGATAVALHPPGRDATRVSAGRSEIPQPAAHSFTPSPDGIVKPRKLGEPCTPGQQVASIAALHSTVPIWAPDGEHLKGAWSCGHLPILWYGDAEVWFDGEAPPVPSAFFADQVARVGGRIQTINGRMAWVHPADAAGEMSTVWIIAGKYSVTVVSTADGSSDRVLDIAREIHIPESIG